MIEGCPTIDYAESAMCKPFISPLSLTGKRRHRMESDAEARHKPADAGWDGPWNLLQQVF